MRQSSATAVRRRLLTLTVAAVLGAATFAASSAAPASAATVLTVYNRLTDYCLDSNYHDPAAANPQQGAVYAGPCNGGNYQNWGIYGNSNGGASFMDMQTGLCLDTWSVFPTYIYTSPCSSPDYGQQWYL